MATFAPSETSATFQPIDRNATSLAVARSGAGPPGGIAEAVRLQAPLWCVRVSAPDLPKVGKVADLPIGARDPRLPMAVIAVIAVRALPAIRIAASHPLQCENLRRLKHHAQPPASRDFTNFDTRPMSACPASFGLSAPISLPMSAAPCAPVSAMAASMAAVISASPILVGR